VGVAEVVDADVEVESGGFDGGQPDAGAEGVPQDRGALAGREQQIIWPEAPGADPVGQLGDQVGRQAQGAGLVVLGVGLGEHPGAGGGVLDRDLHDCLFDPQRALDEVEVAGFEGDQFTPSGGRC